CHRLDFCHVHPSFSTYHSGTLRLPPSFPTRRPSDLPIFVSRDWHPPKTTHFKEFGAACAYHTVRWPHPAELFEMHLPADAVVISDRKSTRLNSSHQIISYAVFCLKNKTTTNKPQQTI